MHYGIIRDVPRFRRVVVTQRGFKSLKLPVEVCLGFLVKLSIFIISVLISEFVGVAIFYLSGGWGRPLPTTVGTSLYNTYD